MPRKTDSHNPADWLLIAESDLEALRMLAKQEIGYTLCRRKLAEVAEKVMKARLRTVIVALLTAGGFLAPFRAPCQFGRVNGQIALDHLRSLDKTRLLRRLGACDKQVCENVLKVLAEMFAEYRITTRTRSSVEHDAGKQNSGQLPHRRVAALRSPRSIPGFPFRFFHGEAGVGELPLALHLLHRITS